MEPYGVCRSSTVCWLSNNCTDGCLGPCDATGPDSGNVREISSGLAEESLTLLYPILISACRRGKRLDTRTNPPFLARRLATQLREFGLQGADPLQHVRLTEKLASILVQRRAWYPHIGEEGWELRRLAVGSCLGVGAVEADAVLAPAVGAGRAFSGASRLLPSGEDVCQPVSYRLSDGQLRHTGNWCTPGECA